MVPDFITANRERIEELCRRYEVQELRLFGSMVRGDFNETSDIDLLVEFQPHVDIGYFELFDMQDELVDIFDRDVDLVIKESLKPRIKPHVLTDAEVVYAV